MATTREIFSKILGSLSEEPITIYQIRYVTKLDARTIREYLAMIELIQASKKVVKEVKGARVFFHTLVPEVEGH